MANTIARDEYIAHNLCGECCMYAFKAKASEKSNPNREFALFADDTVHYCPDCETPSQFGKPCSCKRDRAMGSFDVYEFEVYDWGGSR